MLTTPLGNTHTFEIDGVAYRQTNLPPLAAIGIATKLGSIFRHLPLVLKSFSDLAASVSAAANSSDAIKTADLSSLGAFGEALSDLPDQHRNYMIEAILRVTFRQSGPGFLPTWNAATGAPAEEIDGLTILLILRETYTAQFAPFMTALGSKLGLTQGA